MRLCNSAVLCIFWCCDIMENINLLFIHLLKEISFMLPIVRV